VNTPAGDPDWARLLAAARRSLERTGGSMAGTVAITAPSDAERRIVIGITGVHRSATALRLAVRLGELDAYLTQAFGKGLEAVVAESVGTPLRDRPGERRREAAAREALLRQADTSIHAGADWFQRWMAVLGGDGTLTRIVRSGWDFGAALRVLDALPARDEPAPAFAERVLADTKALGDATLRGLVLRAVALWQDSDPATTAEQERALWESVGVVPDDLASQVLVLNIPATGGVLADWLRQATPVGLPVRLTLHQLRVAPLVMTAADVFVTENPAVLRAASTLGPTAPPMVCTEGVPSAAAHQLLASAPEAVLWWRNDFDWPGVRMTAAALARYPTARPWRMAAADYRAAAGEGPVLIGSPAPTPWDPALSDEMRRIGRAVMEERVLAALIDDLQVRKSQALRNSTSTGASTSGATSCV
jgi:uncharacterized protein (TIGR02679 family)